MMSPWVCSSTVLVILASLATGISLVSPYWVRLSEGFHMGIWMVCYTLEDGKVDCVITPLQNTGDVQVPVWFRVCQALLSVGCLTLDVVLFLCCVLLCCSCCKRSCLVKTIVNLLSLSFLEVGVTVALFAGFMEGTHGVDIEWGYWVCCAGACCNLIVLFIFIYLVCFTDLEEV